VFALLRVQSWASAATSAAQMSTNAVSIRKLPFKAPS
jgi:hypothetical protein